MKCLSVLVTRISETGVADTAEKLMSAITSGRDELRDVYAIGLKTVIEKVPGSAVMADALIRSLLPRLLARGLKPPVDVGAPLVAGAAAAAGGKTGQAAAGATAGAAVKQADVRVESLDIAAELVRRFGDRIDDLDGLMKCLIDAVLEQQLPVVRKRATAAIGTLAPRLTDKALGVLVQALLDHLQKRDVSSEVSRTLIQSIGVVSRQVGHRLERHLAVIVPLFLSQLGSTEEAAEDPETGNSETANELRENILAAFESFFGAAASHGSKADGTAAALALYRAQVVDACLAWSCFDPNYSYGDADDQAADAGDVDMDQNGDAGDDDDWGGDDGGDYGDADDDSSWKSRRAAVRVLTAIVGSAEAAGGGVDARSSLLDQVYTTIAGPLVSRFKEREETVRLEVVACASALVTATHTVACRAAADANAGLGGVAGSGIGEDALLSGASADIDSLAGGIGKSAVHVPAAMVAGVGVTELGAMSADVAAATAAAAVINRLSALLPPLVSASLKHLRDKASGSSKTKGSIYSLLRKAMLAIDAQGGVGVIGGGASARAAQSSLAHLLPCVVTSMKEKTASNAAALRLDVVQFLHALLLVFSGSPAAIAPHLASIVPCVVDGEKDDYYKVVAVAMRCAAITATIIRPVDQANPTSALGAATVPSSSLPALVAPLVASVVTRLSAHDIDQEIKDGAIAAAGALLAHVGDIASVASQATTILGMFGERVKSEITRMQTLRSLAYASCSPLKLDLSACVNAMLPELANFMRQMARPLRAQTLATLAAVLSSQGSKVNTDGLHKVLIDTATPATVTDSDLHLTQLAFDVAVATVTALPPASSSQIVSDTVLRRGVELSTSPLLQGAALASLLSLLREGVSNGAFSPSSLLAAVVSASSPGLNRASLTTAAKCIAVILASMPQSDSNPLVAAFIGDATTATGGLPGPGQGSHPLLSRLVVSEVGRYVDVLTAIDASTLSALLETLKLTVAGVPTAAQGAAGAGAGMASPSTGADDLRIAAALALGGVVAGSMAQGLPGLLSAIQTASTSAAGGATSPDPYVLLQSMREVLQRHHPITPGGPDMKLHVPAVMSLLLSPALLASAEEGLRNIVAECLGRLVVMDPAATLPAVAGEAGASSPAARWSAVSSIKFAVAVPHAAEILAAVLPSHLERLLSTLVDPDLHTRQAALTTVNAIIHSSPLLFGPLLRSVPAKRYELPMSFPPGPINAATLATVTAGMPPIAAPSYPAEGVLSVLYYESIPRADLVREIPLGPFTHKIDEGLPLRKAAFAALEGLIEMVPGILGQEVVPVLCCGMRDADDVRMMAHTTFAKACSRGIVNTLVSAQSAGEKAITGDGLSVSLEMSLMLPGTPEASHVEMARSALRCLHAAIQTVPDLGKGECGRRIVEVIMATQRREPLATLYRAVVAEK